MNIRCLILIVFTASSLATISNMAIGQLAIGTGEVKSLYMDSCAGCHGKNLQGNLATSLLDDTWVGGSNDSDLVNAIKNGMATTGMPAFGETLSDEQIRSLVILIREQKHLSLADGQIKNTEDSNGAYKTKLHSFQLETVTNQPGTLWSLDFLPDGTIITTEQNGKLFLVNARTSTEVKDTPDVWKNGQGGLLEVALHPDYINNQWIYLSFTAHDGKNKNAGTTKVVRGKIKGDQWQEQQTIFEAPSEYHTSAGFHFGSRFAFKDGYLFFSIGDRGVQDQAQDLSLPNGKIHRIHDDGRIPQDNPFVNVENAYKSIWTYGNRNPQGLDLHPLTDELWQTEHGPRGGDEVNLLEKGKNYGWPEITYGMNYNGAPITGNTHLPEMEQPIHYWTPSIAVCGMDFYEGNLFPKWQYNLFVTGLASQELHRLVIVDNQVIEDEIILRNQGRIRDVANGPDGLLYIVINDNPSGFSRIQKLTPL